MAWKVINSPWAVTAFWFAGLLVVLAMLASHARADCRNLYGQRVVQYGYVQQYAQAVVYADKYQVGQALELKAIVRQAIREELPLALRQAQQQPIHGPVPALTARCSKCHSGPDAEGGLRLDGSPLTATQKWRIVEIIGEGKDVPERMQAVVAALTPQIKGAITSEMIAIPTVSEVAKEPPINPYPVPPPDPNGGLQ